MIYTVYIGADTIQIQNLDLVKRTALVNGTEVQFDFRHVGGDLYSLLLNGESYPVQIENHRENNEIRIGPHLLSAVIEDERSAVLRKLQQSAAAPGGFTTVRAPMPGLVVRLEAAPGDRVEKGQGLIVIEAMKMENEIKSPVAGIVAEMLVNDRMAVEKDTPLLRIKH